MNEPPLENLTLEALQNRALALEARGEVDEPLALHERLIELQPTNSRHYAAAGILLLQKRRFKESADRFGQAIFYNNQFPEAYHGLASALLQLGHLDLAAEACATATKHNPQLTPAYATWANILQLAGKTDQALAALDQGLAANPNSEELLFERAALRGESFPAMPPETIIRLFDQAAPSFDQHLVGDLHYQGPTYLRQAIDAVAAQDAVASNRNFNILDLGCGTGLCGVAFKDISARLVGIDLAPNMVAQTKSRAIYHQVHHADLLHFLSSTPPNQFDLILAADVVVYTGDLEPTFAAIARILPTAGLFAFTTEKAENTPGSPPFTLQPTTRFAHSLPYLQSLAKSHNLQIVFSQERPLRTELQSPIPAWIVVMQRGG